MALLRNFKRLAEISAIYLKIVSRLTKTIDLIVASFVDAYLTALTSLDIGGYAFNYRHIFYPKSSK